MRYVRYVIVFAVIFSLNSCSVDNTTLQLLTGPICQERRLIANVWSYRSLPYHLQEKAIELMDIARERDTYYGTDPTGYEGDALSRTLGATLRKEIKTRISIDLLLRVYYLDLQTTYVERSVGVLRVQDGIGSMILPDDPRKWIVEVIWPEQFISPIKSGDEHRLWLFGDEWKSYCTMNVHGLLP
jgi:hypothetical protein